MEATGNTTFIGSARDVSIRDANVYNAGGNQSVTVINNYLAEEKALELLKPAERGGYDIPRCMEGTREGVFEQIDMWLYDPNSATNIMWISGSPGSGKSAIASSLVSKFTELKLLGGSFFCKRGNAVLEDPTTVWRTVASDLVRFHPTIKTTVIEFLNRPSFRDTDIRLHFKCIIEDALRKSYDYLSLTPVVIVLDALDECGWNDDHSAQRRLLLDTLTRWSSLPRSFKLIITSRDERIPPAFHDSRICRKIILETGDSVTPQTHKDISVFFRQRFNDIRSSMSLPLFWPGESVVEQLTQRAAGLFIWAHTAIAFMEARGGNPRRKLGLVLCGNFGRQIANIDVLYHDILDYHFRDSDESIFEIFRRAFGAIIVAKAPLNRDDLARFLEIGDEEAWDFDLILSSMSSVMDGDGPLRLRHLSFAEFLVDAGRCRDARFLVDPSRHHYTFAHKCLRTMDADLRFNICSLSTSYLPNDLIPHDETVITPLLSYSCRFWADHLSVTSFDHEIADQVGQFFHTKLLFWLEVLSLIKKVNIASGALSSIIKWSQDDEIAAFARDAYKFVRAFGAPISQSAPHIYLSALPFAPERSTVSKVYLPKFQRLLKIQLGKMADWPAIETLLEGHTDVVTSVAFSPDGGQIVSGSDDKTIRVWDAETGNIIAASHGHTGPVTCVAFSPNGRHVVSGSGDYTIRIWDAETGSVSSGPFLGHTSEVTSVAFSPDGKYIVSGSLGYTLRVWDAETGIATGGPIFGHTSDVTSVAFSSNGELIVSGSGDQTIRVWDAGTGNVFSGPFYGHTGQVTSVAFSPDGKHIVSGSTDKSIRVWDVKTGNVIASPFHGHTGNITSVSFSPDGKHIVSGSWDFTIRVWDAETGKVIAGPFYGHVGVVTSVAFSPDGRHIMSGSNDKTIRVWDVEIGIVTSSPFHGHTGPVTSVAFSPDGRHIVSGSEDKTIKVWDAETGSIFSGPFCGHTSEVTSVAFSPNGRYIASGSLGYTVRLWDVETGSATSDPIFGHTWGVTSVAFSPDGKLMVSGSEDQTIRVWDVKTGNATSHSFYGHTSEVTSVAFSPDGKHIVFGSTDNSIRVWDIETDDLTPSLFHSHIGPVTSTTFSPDGRHIVSGSWDSTIRVWDIETGNVTSGPFYGHTSRVTSVAFSPDGQHIVSGSTDKTIRVWDAQTGNLTSGPFYGHTNEITSVAFSPNGIHVVSGSEDHMLRVWDTKLDSSSVFKSTTPIKGGWAEKESSELLFWVPPWSQTGLWRPNNTTVIGQDIVKLDFCNFVHGTSWDQCKSDGV